MIRHRSLCPARPAVLTALLGMAVALGCSSSDGGGTGGSSGTGGRGGTGGSTGGTGGSTGGTGGSTGGTGGSTGGTGGGAALATYKTCDRAMMQGTFVVSRNDGAEQPFSDIQGQVMDGVEQVRQVKLVKQVGDCQILQPPEAFMCTPQCDVNTQQCTPTGCKAKPRPKDVGTVTISGLKNGTQQLMKIDLNYSNMGSLPHPVFDEGADITLQASGAAGWGPFTLKGWGLAPLVAPAAAVTVQMGQPVTLTWTPPSKAGPTRVLVDFSINRHGTIDAWLECTVPDTGSFTVTGEMTTELFKNGVSGFPSVNLTRQSGDTTTVMGGCVQLLVTAPISRDLNVPGVVSCNDEKPCAGGKVCREDLTCPP
jgi:hypothetical protein